MKQIRHTTDQIISKLRQADVELGKGKKVPEIICKLLEITEQRRPRGYELPPKQERSTVWLKLVGSSIPNSHS